MGRVRAFAVGLLLSIAGCWPAYAATQLPIPLLSGPSDPSQMNATLNGVIAKINAILGPVILQTSGGENFISLSGGVSGAPAVIGLAPGAGADAGIQINPNGSGNIILFSQSNTGVLQLGNQASFVSAPGLSPNPIGSRLASLYGVKNTVQGMFIFKDWLGRTRGLPVY